MRKIAFDDKITLFGRTIYHKVRIMYTDKDADMIEIEEKG